MKILMVCLGNICRSPLAEGVLRYQLEKAGISGVEVDSAGTSGWHNGENPDARSVNNARRNGVDISRLVSRKFTSSDFERFDRIYVMDQSNLRDVLALAKHKEHESKVDLLLNAAHPGKNKAVPDPYYGGENGFQEVFDLVTAACHALVKEIESARR
ncbi:MAG TPA: low molecular weight protein-tyrosine-phosphatase [Bacteroidia bacterium]|nr:low molecular weight protein-tyrosine-phosphatase [Bacteroidia bacterium]